MNFGRVFLGSRINLPLHNTKNKSSLIYGREKHQNSAYIRVL